MSDTTSEYERAHQVLEYALLVVAFATVYLERWVSSRSSESQRAGGSLRPRTSAPPFMPSSFGPR